MAEIVKQIACSLYLRGNPYFKTTILIGQRNADETLVWQALGSGMNTLKLPGEKGIWMFDPEVPNKIIFGVYEDWDVKHTPMSLTSFLHIFQVPKDFLDYKECGPGITGGGNKYSPLPWQSVDYNIWYGCI
jgi:hypothetical protein